MIRKRESFSRSPDHSSILSICTRPDLLQAVHELTRKMFSPRVIDLQKAKRAISYLASTADYCLVFKANDTEEIFGWADSSFNSGEGDRWNRYRYCFQLGTSSGMFVAVCKRSTLVAQSSTEAEFYCPAEATREMLWIRSFLQEILEEMRNNFHIQHYIHHSRSFSSLGFLLIFYFFASCFTTHFL